MALLRIENINAYYKNIQVLFDVSFKINQGEIVAIFGGNGAGKTTLTKAILNAVRTEGRIFFEEKNISLLPTDVIIRQGIAYVPDNRGTFANMTVEENLKLGAITRNDRIQIQKDLEKSYEQFPSLAKYKNKNAGYLSGGEQQMLAIARALMLHPKLLIIDEPSNGLAPIAIQNIFKNLDEIHRHEKIAILLVEQNTSVAMEIAENLYLLEGGKIVLSGSIEEFKNNPHIQQSYLGV